MTDTGCTDQLKTIHRRRLTEAGTHQPISRPVLEIAKMPQFVCIGENYLIRPEFGIQTHFDEVAATIETMAFKVTFH